MKLIVVLISFVLTGCATQIADKTQMVYIPVPVKCEPTLNVTEIDAPFDQAKKDQSLYDKFRLAIVELELVKGQNKELKAALKECTK